MELEVSRDLINWDRSYSFSMPGKCFVVVYFLLGFIFKQKNQEQTWYLILRLLAPPFPMSTMRSRDITITKEIMENKCTKKKIGVGPVVKEKVRYIEENTSEGRIRRMRKDMVGCVEALVVKKKCLIHFKMFIKKIWFHFRFHIYVWKRRYDLRWMIQYQTSP